LSTCPMCSDSVPNFKAGAHTVWSCHHLIAYTFVPTPFECQEHMSAVH
jgi:hypothetical protein